MANIILIEDHAQTARMVTKLLSKNGHTVETFASGAEGLTKILDSVPNLLLIDLGLPDIDGQTVIAILRQQLALQTVPIIAFTAWPHSEAQKMATAYGFDGLITKPIDTRRFAQQIEEFLQPCTTNDR